VRQQALRQHVPCQLGCVGYWPDEAGYFYFAYFASASSFWIRETPSTRSSSPSA
jgi:hypothetical protein